MKITKDTEELFELVSQKSSLKTSVYNNTHQAFNIVKETIRELSKEYNHYHKSNGSMAPLETKHKGKFEIDLKFGGDILLFMMHTNVFEFPRQHEIMKTPYVKDDPTRSYCGIINIYNFIADSFKYHRVNDIGYLIGRVFINKDNHYFMEGKRELGLIYNNFEKNIFDRESVEATIKAAIKYTVNFDLLTPNYDLVKFVSVNDINRTLDSISVQTGKRLGYKFQADVEEKV